MTAAGPGVQPAPDLRSGRSPDAVWQLERCGAAAWRSLGEDPQFIYRLAPPLPAGWYRLRAMLRAVEGELVDPCVYLDFGHGFSEDLRAPANFAARPGELDTVLHFPDPVHRLRLDPANSACMFEFRGLRWERIGEAEATWLMARALRLRDGDGTGRWHEDLAAAIRGAGPATPLERAWAAYAGAGEAPQDAAYQQWIAEREAFVLARVPAPARENQAPTFTVVMLPEEGATLDMACVDALLAQSYPDLEILVPAGAAAAARPELMADPRVRKWDGTPATSCAGLAQARGRYLTWVSSGQRFPPHALAAVATAAEAHPDALLFYTDEDFLGADGRRRWPYFKPAWSPDLQQQQDYVGPSSFFAREWLERWHRGRPAPRAWRQAAVLAAGVEAGPDAVVHIPMVARHHLGLPGEFATPLQELRQAGELEEVVAEHLARTQPGARLEAPTGRGLHRVRHPVPGGTRCDIIIPTRDRADLLSVCVDSLLELTEGVEFQVTIVDNGSSEPGTHAYLKRVQADPRVRVLSYDAPFNYSAINNFAVSRCDGDVVVLLNNDIEVIDPGWLAELVSQACRHHVGAVGARLLYPDRTVQHAGVILGVGGVAAHAYAQCRRTHPGQFGRALAVQETSAVTGACLAVRRSIFDEVGGLDEALEVAFNDVDLCLRILQAGYRNLWTPHAELIHHESASRGSEDNPAKQARFASEVRTMQRRWGPALERDLAYNPNLSLRELPFSIDPGREADIMPRAALLPLASIRTPP